MPIQCNYSSTLPTHGSYLTITLSEVLKMNVVLACTSGEKVDSIVFSGSLLILTSDVVTSHVSPYIFIKPLAVEVISINNVDFK